MSRLRSIISRPIALLGLFLFFVRLLPGQLPDAPSAARRPVGDYVGDAACRDCHQAQFESYLSSAHHSASRVPSQGAIDGKFTPGSNILRTSNPSLFFVMSATHEGFFQTAFAKLPPAETITHRERFDLVIGSGRKGQTYLYWKGDELFELPVSYWTETDRWINSPGYPDGLPSFDKPIIPRCLDCHSTYFESLSPPSNRFNKTNMVLGITCERCHGLGGTHVARNRTKTPLQPGQSEDIVNPKSLSRARQMDLCALCHAGPGTPKAPSFSFGAGEVLAEYLSIAADAPDTPTDVHGHQVQQLSSSRCFRSTAMTCSTCHDVHKPQRATAAFSERCLTCHRIENCGKFSTLGSQILHRCADCHMPLQQSNQIVFDADGRQIKPQVRTHRIAIYKEVDLP
jgi:Cytochrome c554 and c-prime